MASKAATPDQGRWTVRGERTLYDCQWLKLNLVDVQEPGGRRFEHHVVRMQRVVATVVLNDQSQVLMLWRHRFITDTWAWELPTGIVEPGEQPEVAAAREVEEETGWRPDGLERLVMFQPAIGIADTPHELFLARRAHRISQPTDDSEGGRADWLDLSTIDDRIHKGEIIDAPSLIGLLMVTGKAEH